MLSDTARKLLMIMTHSSGHHGHMPTLQELEIKSGRKPTAIKEGMGELVEQNYIQWKYSLPVESAVIIEGWERDDPAAKEQQGETKQPKQTSTPGNMDYWQYY